MLNIDEKGSRLNLHRQPVVLAKKDKREHITEEKNMEKR